MREHTKLVRTVLVWTFACTTGIVRFCKSQLCTAQFTRIKLFTVNSIQTKFFTEKLAKWLILQKIIVSLFASTRLNSMQSGKTRHNNVREIFLFLRILHNANYSRRLRTCHMRHQSYVYTGKVLWIKKLNGCGVLLSYVVKWTLYIIEWIHFIVVFLFSIYKIINSITYCV